MNTYYHYAESVAKSAAIDYWYDLPAGLPAEASSQTYVML